MQSYKLRQASESGSYPLYQDLLSSRKYILKIGLLVLAFFYLYASVWTMLAKTWWIRDDYSYGFLIPPISLYLVWLRRERLMHFPIEPAYLAGLSVVLTAGAMLLLGKVGGVITLQELSLLAMISGLVLFLLGKGYLKALSFPIAYLLFMIPIADEVIAPLHWSFQLLTAKMAVALLQALGFTAFLENQYIVLPNIILEVAKACSGINYLISIIALGVPLAYVSQKNIWCRFILVVSAVMIGIIGNWVRVAAIGIWAYYGGTVVHGPVHIFQALFVSQIGFIALFVGAWVLAKIPAAASKKLPSNPAKAEPGKGDVESQRRLLDRSWLAAFLVLVGLSAYLSFYERGPVPLKTDLNLFPITIGDWNGKESDPREAVFRVEGADHELTRVYRSPSGHEIQLYIAYFESQHHPKKLVNYITARLHRNAVTENIRIDQMESITVNETRLPNDRGVRSVYFWYDINGKTHADRYKAMLANTLNALLHGRTNGALILISSDPKGRENALSMIGEERAFIRELVPVLSLYLP